VGDVAICVARDRYKALSPSCLSQIAFSFPSKFAILLYDTLHSYRLIPMIRKNVLLPFSGAERRMS
jgi:hypothetical protein